MFTGLIEEIGTISRPCPGSGGQLTLRADIVRQGCRLGDSIAVNGVCLTVTAQAGEALSFDVSPETLRRSNLGRLKTGQSVNLERALAADGRFGGHLVSGHIDGIGRLQSRVNEGNSVIFSFTAPPEIARYLIVKGSIAVDGISLTITALQGERFSVAVIPHSLDRTTLAERKTGDPVNLESDLVAKYIEKLLPGGQPAGADKRLDLATLRAHGFA